MTDRGFGKEFDGDFEGDFGWDFGREPGGTVGGAGGAAVDEGRGDPFEEALALANATAPLRVRHGAEGSGAGPTTGRVPYATREAAAANSSATGGSHDIPYTPDDPFSLDDPMAAGNGAARSSGPSRAPGNGASRTSGPSRASGPVGPEDHEDPADPPPPTGHGSRPTPVAVPWHTARDIAERAVAGPPEPATSALGDALGRTLAAPLTALTDLPSFDTSAMDGWAVSGPGPWRLDHPAGTSEAGPLPASSQATPLTGRSTTDMRSRSPPVRACRPVPPPCCAVSTARSVS